MCCNNNWCGCENRGCCGGNSGAVALQDFASVGGGCGVAMEPRSVGCGCAAAAAEAAASSANGCGCGCNCGCGNCWR